MNLGETSVDKCKHFLLLWEMREQGYMERKLQLLHKITGAFQPGILSELMGVTGAGKTTLLDVLAGRKTGGVIEGDIRVGGYPKFQQTFARISGYCEQTDVHSPQITVGESVAYSAWLRLPTEIDIKTRNVSYTYRSNELYTKIQLHNYVSQVLEATRSDFNMTLFLFSLTGICHSSS
jgi:ABC-type multidrug transport system ATPase subunit